MRSIIFVALLILVSNSIAEGLKSEKQTREFSDKIMDQFITKKFKEGLALAKPYWPIPEVEIDGLTNQIEQQWPIVDQRFGQAIGKEFISGKRIGKSFLRYYYLHKFENHSIYWQIDFYKPRNEWKVNSIIFLDSLEALYE